MVTRFFLCSKTKKTLFLFVGKEKTVIFVPAKQTNIINTMSNTVNEFLPQINEIIIFAKEQGYDVANITKAELDKIMLEWINLDRWKAITEKVENNIDTFKRICK